MTVNVKIEFLWIFWRFRAAKHISRANCAETNWNRHEQSARKFRWSKSWFSRFKEICARGYQRAVPP